MLRIDDVVSGVKKKEKERQQAPGGMPGMGGGMPEMSEQMETFGDARDG